MDRRAVTADPRYLLPPCTQPVRAHVAVRDMIGCRRPLKGANGTHAGLSGTPAGGSRRGRYFPVVSCLCNIDYEHTQSTKAGAPGVDPGQLITESRLFPQRQTDVATGAPCCDRKVNADRVLFGRKHRLKCCQNRGIEPTQGRGVRTTPASTRGHMWMGARTRTHELIGANRS